jgi:hypothetical protein
LQGSLLKLDVSQWSWLIDSQSVSKDVTDARANGVVFAAHERRPNRTAGRERIGLVIRLPIMYDALCVAGKTEAYGTAEQGVQW